MCSQEKTDVALKALQLSLILLPASVRDEILRLLAFTKLCCDDDSLQLSPKVPNFNNSSTS